MFRTAAGDTLRGLAIHAGRPHILAVLLVDAGDDLVDPVERRIVALRDGGVIGHEGALERVGHLELDEVGIDLEELGGGELRVGDDVAGALRRFSTTMGTVSAGVIWLTSGICSMTSSYIVAA